MTYTVYNQQDSSWRRDGLSLAEAAAELIERSNCTYKIVTDEHGFFCLRLDGMGTGHWARSEEALLRSIISEEWGLYACMTDAEFAAMQALTLLEDIIDCCDADDGDSLANAIAAARAFVAQEKGA